MDLTKVTFTQKKTPELEEAVRHLPEFLFKYSDGRHYPEIIVSENLKSKQIIIYSTRKESNVEEIILPIGCFNVHHNLRDQSIIFRYLGRNYKIFIPTQP